MRQKKKFAAKFNTAFTHTDPATFWNLNREAFLTTRDKIFLQAYREGRKVIMIECEIGYWAADYVNNRITVVMSAFGFRIPRILNSLRHSRKRERHGNR